MKKALYESLEYYVRGYGINVGTFEFIAQEYWKLTTFELRTVAMEALYFTNDDALNYRSGSVEDFLAEIREEIVD